MATPKPISDFQSPNEELFYLAANAVKDFAIFLLDHNGRITSWNPGAEYILGYEPPEILGQPLSRLFTPEDEARGECEKELRAAAIQGRSEDVRWHVRKDGTRFWASGTVTSLRDINGALKGFVKIMRDSTHQKEIHDSLRSRAEELLAADEQKKIFLATLAHELKNPLAPILYSAQILRQRVGPHLTLHQPLEIIEQQARQLNRLVDDLLDVVRAETGKVTLDRQAVQLGAIIQQAVEAVRPLIDSRKHRLYVSHPEEPIWLEADAQRLQQVFVNLLNNAAKYTDEGGSIWVSTTRENSEAVVRIRDTGVGIPADQLPHIFGLFMQAHAGSRQSQGGLGIGLALVKNLVELHGGTIRVYSKGQAQGSEFSVYLPISATTQQEGFVSEKELTPSSH